MPMVTMIMMTIIILAMIILAMIMAIMMMMMMMMAIATIMADMAGIIVAAITTPIPKSPMNGELPGLSLSSWASWGSKSAAD